MKIKAVAFDFAGVIEIWGGRSAMDITSELLGVPIDEFRSAYFKYNHLSNVHNLPWEDMFMQVVAEFDNRTETAEMIRATLQSSQSENRINTELVALFPLLRKQGLRVGVLSNATSGLRDRLQKYGILELVDTVVISGEIGFQKPHKEAFEVLFERLQVQPDETIFVDDSPKSLENAEEIGYVPILFKDNQQLRVDLEHLGIVL